METLDNDISESKSLSQAAVADLVVAANWKIFCGIAGVVMSAIGSCFFLYMLLNTHYYRTDETIMTFLAAALSISVLVMCILMLRSASAITVYSNNRQLPALETYLQRQKNFWRMAGATGVISLAMFAYMLLMIFNAGYD